MPLINGRYYCCFSSFLPDVYLYTCICFPTHKRQGVCLIYLCSPAPRRLTRQRRDSRNCLVKEQTSVFTSCWHQPQNAFRVQDSIHLSWEKARCLTFHRSGGKRILEAVPMAEPYGNPLGKKVLTEAWSSNCICPASSPSWMNPGALSFILQIRRARPRRRRGHIDRNWMSGELN